MLGGLLAVAAGGGLRVGLDAAWRAGEAHEAALREARVAGRREGQRAALWVLAVADAQAETNLRLTQVRWSSATDRPVTAFWEGSRALRRMAEGELAGELPAVEAAFEEVQGAVSTLRAEEAEEWRRHAAGLEARATQLLDRARDGVAQGQPLRAEAAEAARLATVRERAGPALTEIQRVLESRLQTGRSSAVFLRASLRDSWRVLIETARQLDDPRGIGPRGGELADADARFQAALRMVGWKLPFIHSCGELARARDGLQGLLDAPDLARGLGLWVRDWQARVEALEARGPIEHQLCVLLDHCRDARRAIEEGGSCRYPERVAASYVAVNLLAAELRALGHADSADRVLADATRTLAQVARRLSRSSGR